MARAVEIPAGSESMARMDKETSRNLGDPSRSCESEYGAPNEPF